MCMIPFRILDCYLVDSDHGQHEIRYSAYCNSTKKSTDFHDFLKYFKTTPSAAKCIEYSMKYDSAWAKVYENITDTETLLVSYDLTCENVEPVWIDGDGEVGLGSEQQQTIRLRFNVPPHSRKMLLLRPMRNLPSSYAANNIDYNLTTSLSKDALEMMTRATGEVSECIVL